MGKDLYAAFPESKAVFDKAQQILGWDIKTKCFEGPENMLKMTHISQPAIFTVSMAILAAFRELLRGKEIVPSYMAGLSLGEYSALTASGFFQFEDALRLVRKRAELMNEAASKQEGKMAAIIGLDASEVKKICSCSGRVDIANFNSPGQLVISGEKEAVDRAKKSALEKGAKVALDLGVSGAFHSNFMWEAAMKFKDILEERVSMDIPKVPVVCNVNARPAYKVVQIIENLTRQIYSPVLWEDSMRFMLSEGVTKFYEFGPGKVLKGLMRRIEPSAEVVSVEKREDIENEAQR